MSERKNTVKMLAAMLIWGSIGIFRRYISLDSSLLAFLRGLIGALIILLYLRFTGHKETETTEGRTIFWLAVSGVVMGLNWILLFEAYKHTSVSTATMCYYLQPTILIMLAPLFFRERMTPIRLLCALLALGGMFLVSGMAESGAAGNGLRGIAEGTGAAFLYAAVVIINKKFPDVNVYRKTIIQLGAAAAALFPYLLLTGSFTAVQADTGTVLMVLLVGVLHTGIAYLLYFSAASRMPAHTTALLSYVDPLSALCFSALILGEKMTVLNIIGAVMILGAAVIGSEK